MKLEQSFEVTAPLERVWDALVDIERVAPCLPGAEVTGRSEDGSYGGTFKVKIGPTSAAYSGQLHMDDIDVGAHRAVMHAEGTDRRGQGGAKATIVSTVADNGNGTTRVEILTEYHITGRLARFGRGGMIEEISNRLLGEFAKSLQQVLAAGGEATTITAAGRPSPPVDGNGADASEGPEAHAAAATSESPGTEGRAAEEGVLPGVEPPGAASQPVQGLSLLGSVVWARAKRHPVPLAAIAVGLLVLIRAMSRRD